MIKFKAYQLTVICEDWLDENEFSVQAHCEIKEENGLGGGAVLMYIVSPLRLQHWLSGDEFKYELGHGHIIVNDYNQKEILFGIQKLIDGSEAKTWEELKVYMEKYFHWI